MSSVASGQAADRAATIRLRAATLDEFEPLLRLVEEFHAFEGVVQDDAVRRASLQPLLADPALGRIWFIDCDAEAVGYVAVCFGYSIEFRGRDAFVDEVFIGEAHRGRGIGTRALRELGVEVAKLGLKALHLEVDRGNKRARRLYESAGFRLRERYCLMSWRLPA